jgi:hypothetical protein
MPELAGLGIADPPQRWEALGFTVSGDVLVVGGVALQLGVTGTGIVGWAVTGVEVAVDGLATVPAAPVAPAVEHPNGAVGLDHVVVMTPDFARTAAALEAVGLPLRRVIDGPRGRMGFRRLGPVILEVVAAPEDPQGPARFWGLVVVVADLDGLAARLDDRLGSIRAAVQPGRRIATLRAEAGLTTAVAFMD